MTLAAVLLLFSPYLFSRALSPWRQLQTHAIANGETGSSDGLTIASYNIAHGRGTAESNWDGGSGEERLQRLDAIAELLGELDADIVVLNEVDFDSSWSEGVNQAEYLSERAGYPFRAEQRNLDFRFLFWTWRFGNAVLSRYPIEHAEVIDLPGYSIWETVFAGKKRAVLCDVRVQNRTVRVVGAHLSHRSEAVRVRSTEMLVDLANESETPVVVAGDLNSTPPGFPHSLEAEGGKNAIAVIDASGVFRRMPRVTGPESSNYTFHSERPRSVIDWILIPAGWGFESYEVIPSVLSDHRPVRAEISDESDELRLR